MGLLPLKRPNCREVLECGSALPLWEWARCLESGRALPHSKTLARKPRLALVQGRRERVRLEICPKSGWRLGGVRTFGVVACVQEVALTPGDLIHFIRGASEMDEDEALRKASERRS